jgi:hypothetical protein
VIVVTMNDPVTAAFHPPAARPIAKNGLIPPGTSRSPSRWPLKGFRGRIVAFIRKIIPEPDVADVPLIGHSLIDAVSLDSKGKKS